MNRQWKCSCGRRLSSAVPPLNCRLKRPGKNGTDVTIPPEYTRSPDEYIIKNGYRVVCPTCKKDMKMVRDTDDAQ